MKSILVIGMGRLGRHFATKMLALGNDVMIVDKDDSTIEQFSSIFTDSQIGDCRQEGVLRALGINNFDLCFVAIGEDFQASLEITSMLKDLGANYIVSKAREDRQAKFLKLVGANEVVYPEKEIAEKIEEFFIDNGADELAFETIVASGENSSKPHAKISDRKIELGDPIIIDMGCKYKGYCSDMTRTIFAGYIPENIKNIYNLVLKNQLQTQKDLREGASIRIISKNVENDFKLNGYDLIHSLGHGVGLEIHELPYINSKNDNLLKENMIITNEPGIYLPNNYGVRIEDTVLITKSGCINLTKSDKNYIIVDEK